MTSATSSSATSHSPRRRRHRIVLATALSAGAAFMAFAPPETARAETFVVTSPDPGLVDPDDGSLLTLAGAVAGASDGDIITFSPSLIGFTIDTANVPDIAVDLTIDGTGTLVTLTSTGGDVFTVDDPDADVIFRNLRVTDPVTGGTTPSSAFVAVEAESIEIADSTVRNAAHGALIDDTGTATLSSFVVFDGAAVAASNTDAVHIRLSEFDRAVDDVAIRLDGVTGAFINSTELDGNGLGGIVASDVDGLALIDVDVTDNGRSPGTGSPTGGIEISSAGGPSAVAITDSTIAGNVGAGAGGITITGEVRLTLRSSTLSANDGADAEAIAASLTDPDATLTIDDSTISSHVDELAPSDAAPVLAVGGISTGVTWINRSAFVSNSATRVIEATGTDVDLVDSTLTGNDMSAAIVGAGPGSTVEIIRSTISANSSGGPAVLDLISSPTTGTISVLNSIVTANGAAPLEQDVDPTAGVTVTHSLVPVASGSIGTGVISTDDPAFINVGDNGGPTLTMLPGPDSPAIDAGDPFTTGSGDDGDQRGARRVVNGRVDMGAVERQRSALVETVPPARLVDTRDGEATIDGLFAGIGRRADGETTELPVTDRAGVPADALAVIVNVTAVAPDTLGFITVHPCLGNLPLASSLNFAAGRDASNEVIAELDPDGKICLFNRSGLHLVVDVVGFVPAESQYDTVGPSRYLDTRDLGQTVDDQFEALGIREPDTELRLPIAGRPGVPASATTVVVNIAAVAPEDTGFVTVHPCLDERPLTSSLNYEPGVNRANEIVAGLSDAGEICLFTSARTHLIVDVVGELDGETKQVPVPPARLVDTRDGNPTVDGAQEAIGRLPSGTTLVVEVGDRAGVPDDASAAVVNVTAIRPSERAFVTMWDCVGDRPLASSLNAQLANERVGNELVVSLNADGDVCLFNSVEMDLTVDVVGYLPA